MGNQKHLKVKVIAVIAIVNLIIALSAYYFRPAKIDYDTAVVNISFSRPASFPKPSVDLRVNPVSPDGFKLGRLLFYDPVLSLDQSISCNNCHQPAAAFANPGAALSIGIKGCIGERNAPPLFNLAWQHAYMWDGRISTIDSTALNAISNSCEMASTPGEIANRLQSTKVYPALFEKAFGDRKISPERIVKAISQFTTLMVSANSRYDKYICKEPGGYLSAEESKGYLLFQKKCAACHTEPLFTDQSFKNNGLDLISRDPGRKDHTHKAEDAGLFRVPTLRNVAVTAPYMHDGRFSSLEEVLKHYASGIKPNSHLDKSLRLKGKLGIDLSAADQHNIAAFLKTLTDTTYINDPKFQKP
ncbi:cytochrome c peroxidase [Mucilaginibacter sp. cycad4]|uniref:cytochrome-c peroxidase n=1 Tax=Mucilaginibacter sp. cycad4 TaxID=3342096 RepID=UPI002AAA6495|nr:cytochrome c peroxidase [Mucilaginibacter gossypii]WPU99123.1 cytochrome c peroxidase [Mucilaginibacter gossypii]